MTAKSRRHKLDKKRKSDEHPQSRRREEDRRRPEGPRGRTGLSAAVSVADEAVAFDGGPVVKEIRQARILYATPTAEESAPGWIESVGDFEVKPLNEVDPNEYNFTGGWPEGSRIYLNDSEKELFDRVHEQRAAEIEAGIRSPRPPHAKTAS